MKETRNVTHFFCECQRCGQRFWSPHDDEDLCEPCLRAELCHMDGVNSKEMWGVLGRPETPAGGW